MNTYAILDKDYTSVEGRMKITVSDKRGVI